MATGQHQAGMTLSLLDRLLDLQPESQAEAPVSSWEQQSEVLNSRCCSQELTGASA